MFKRVKVSEFEQAVLFRDGRLVRRLDPGIHWVRGEAVIVDLRRRDTEVLAAPVQLRELLPLGIRLRISYRVKDPVAALLQVYEYRTHLANDAISTVHRVVSPVSMAELSSERVRLEQQIHDRLALETSAYGLRVEEVSILEYRLPRSIRKRLKQMEVTGPP
ncbi:MAG TPA: SPFH domain-containing protein [Planctomycetota bacterium]|nr:SPFH domain-containing protein [Planctomycetota bacterium]